MKKKSPRILLLLSMVMAFIASASLLLTPLTDIRAEETNHTLAMIEGFAFWSALLLTTALSTTLEILRCHSGGKIGVPFIRFFNNKIAKTADIIFFASIMFFVIALGIQSMPPTIGYISSFLFSLSLQAHCILNSRGFEWVYTKSL